MKLRLLKSSIFKWAAVIHFGTYLAVSQWPLVSYVVICIAPKSHVALEIQHHLCCKASKSGAAPNASSSVAKELPAANEQCGPCVDVAFKLSSDENHVIPIDDSKSNAHSFNSHSESSLYGNAVSLPGRQSLPPSFVNTSLPFQSAVLRC